MQYGYNYIHMNNRIYLSHAQTHYACIITRYKRKPSCSRSRVFKNDSYTHVYLYIIYVYPSRTTVGILQNQQQHGFVQAMHAYNNMRNKYNVIKRSRRLITYTFVVVTNAVVYIHNIIYIKWYPVIYIYIL